MSEDLLGLKHYRSRRCFEIATELSKNGHAAVRHPELIKMVAQAGCDPGPVTIEPACFRPQRPYPQNSSPNTPSRRLHAGGRFGGWFANPLTPGVGVPLRRHRRRWPQELPPGRLVVRSRCAAGTRTPVDVLVLSPGCRSPLRKEIGRHRIRGSLAHRRRGILGCSDRRQDCRGPLRVVRHGSRSKDQSLQRV